MSANASAPTGQPLVRLCLPCSRRAGFLRLNVDEKDVVEMDQRAHRVVHNTILCSDWNMPYLVGSNSTVPWPLNRNQPSRTLP
jgi:hypothetical protein